MSATGYLRCPAGWSMPVLSPAARLKWLSTQDTLWRRSSTTRTTTTGAMTVILPWWNCGHRWISRVSLGASLWDSSTSKTLKYVILWPQFYFFMLTHFRKQGLISPPQKCYTPLIKNKRLLPGVGFNLPTMNNDIHFKINLCTHNIL